MHVEVVGTLVYRVNDDHPPTASSDSCERRVECANEQVTAVAASVQVLRQREASEQEAGDHLRRATTDRGREVVATDGVGEDAEVTDDLVVIEPDVDASGPGAVSSYARLSQPDVEISVAGREGLDRMLRREPLEPRHLPRSRCPTTALGRLGQRRYDLAFLAQLF